MCRFNDEDVAHGVLSLLGNTEYGVLAAQLLRLMLDTPPEVSSSRSKKRLVELATSAAPEIVSDVVELIIKWFAPPQPLFSFAKALSNCHTGTARILAHLVPCSPSTFKFLRRFTSIWNAMRARLCVQHLPGCGQCTCVPQR